MNAMHAISGGSNNGRPTWQPAGYVDELKPIVDLSLDFKLAPSGLVGDTDPADGRIMVGWHAGGSNYIDLWFIAKLDGTAEVWGRELFGTVDPDAGSLGDTVVGLNVAGWNTMEMHIDQNAGPHGETSARLNGGAWTTIPRSMYDIENLGLSDLQFTLSGQVYVDNISQTGTPEPATIALLGMGALALIRKRR